MILSANAQDPTWEARFRKDLRLGLRPNNAFNINANHSARPNPYDSNPAGRRPFSESSSAQNLSRPLHLLGSGHFPFQITLAAPRYYGTACQIPFRKQIVSDPATYHAALKWFRYDYAAGTLGDFYRQDLRGTLGALNPVEEVTFLIKYITVENQRQETQVAAEVSEAVADYLGARHRAVKIQHAESSAGSFFLRGDYGSKAHLTLALHSHWDGTNRQIFASGFMGRLIDDKAPGSENCWEGIAFQSKPEWSVPHVE